MPSSTKVSANAMAGKSAGVEAAVLAVAGMWMRSVLTLPDSPQSHPIVQNTRAAQANKVNMDCQRFIR